MTDPREARDAAAAAGDRAAEQLEQARQREPAVRRASLLSRHFLRENHLYELLEAALGRRA